MKEKFTKIKNILKDKFVKAKNLLKDKTSKIKVDKRVALIVLISAIFIIAIVAVSCSNNSNENATETTTEEVSIGELATNQETINKLATVEKSIRAAENKVKNLHPKVTSSTINYYLDEVQTELEKLKKDGTINDFERNDTNIIVDLGVFYAYAPIIEDADAS